MILLAMFFVHDGGGVPRVGGGDPESVGGMVLIP